MRLAPRRPYLREYLCQVGCQRYRRGYMCVSPIRREARFASAIPLLLSYPPSADMKVFLLGALSFITLFSGTCFMGVVVRAQSTTESVSNLCFAHGDVESSDVPTDPEVCNEDEPCGTTLSLKVN
jgi:hypothetical protein